MFSNIYLEFQIYLIFKKYLKWFFIHFTITKWNLMQHCKSPVIEYKFVRTTSYLRISKYQLISNHAIGSVLCVKWKSTSKGETHVKTCCKLSLHHTSLWFRGHPKIALRWGFLTNKPYWLRKQKKQIFMIHLLKLVTHLTLIHGSKNPYDPKQDFWIME